MQYPVFPHTPISPPTPFPVWVLGVLKSLSFVQASPLQLSSCAPRKGFRHMAWAGALVHVHQSLPTYMRPLHSYKYSCHACSSFLPFNVLEFFLSGFIYCVCLHRKIDYCVSFLLPHCFHLQDLKSPCAFYHSLLTPPRFIRFRISTNTPVNDSTHYPHNDLRRCEAELWPKVSSLFTASFTLLLPCFLA